mmetsp:Transcript_9867/g.21976  ORF Transcript_9867/g.21976 Transcript_9867/m.21976 type:complete len:209 (-) Transcript_9867:412-1038(-)
MSESFPLGTFAVTSEDPSDLAVLSTVPPSAKRVSHGCAGARLVPHCVTKAFTSGWLSSASSTIVPSPTSNLAKDTANARLALAYIEVGCAAPSSSCSGGSTPRESMSAASAGLCMSMSSRERFKRVHRTPRDSPAAARCTSRLRLKYFSACARLPITLQHSANSPSITPYNPPSPRRCRTTCTARTKARSASAVCPPSRSICARRKSA